MNYTLTIPNSLRKSAAVLAILSLLATSAPIGVLTAFAADVYGPESYTLQKDDNFVSTIINASGHENLTFSFDYDAEALDNGDTFTYGWKQSGGTLHDIATFNGTNEGGGGGPTNTNEIGSVSVPLPSGAQISDLEVYVNITADTPEASDQVFLTNIKITGNVTTPPSCTPQFNVAGPTDIQNSNTGDYFDSISDALSDCDTADGDTIQLLGDISISEQITINRPITLEGNGNTIGATFSKTNNSNNSVIGVQSDDVTISNLTIDGTLGTDLHGINVYVSTNIDINDVTINNPKRTSVVVNGSEVTVDNLSTSGSEWHAINAAPGSGVTEPTILTVVGTSVHDEDVPTPHIYIDDTSKNVTVNDTNNQYEIVYDGPNPNNGAVTARSYRLKAPVTPLCSESDSVSNTTFDTFAIGDVDGQKNWSSTGPYDQEIVENTYGYSSFGCQSLRVSNAVTTGSFGDQTFAAPLINSVGEVDATAGTFSEGTRYDRYEVEFDIASTKPNEQQSGLALSVSPDRGDGSRMSYLSFADTTGGIDVTFYDVQGEDNPANFSPTNLATLDRSVPHTIKFVMEMNDGPSNDVVEIYIDGVLEHTGTSWENYYRFDAEASAEQSPRLMKTLLFRSAGTAVPANSGNGFLFDNISLIASDTSVTSSEITNPTADGEVVSGTATLTAFYSDENDDGNDNVQWAVRFNSCSSGNVLGNVDGFNDPYLWDGENFTASFDTTTVADGDYCFVFNPTEDSGDVNQRLTRLFTVDNVIADTTAPIVTITSPIEGSAVNGEIDVTGTVTDNVALSHYVVTLYPGTTDLSNGLPHGSAIAVPGWGQVNTSSDDVSFINSLDTTTLADGEYQIRVAARDAADNRDVSDPYNGGTTSVHIVRIVVDNQAPTITVKPESVSTGPNTFKEVSFKLYDEFMVDKLTLNGVEKDLTNNQWSDLNYVVPGSFGAVVGENTLVLYDVAGNSTTYVFNLVVDTEKPNVTIITPEDGDILSTGTVMVMGTSSDADSEIEEVKYTVTEIDGIGGSFVANVDSGVADGDEDWEFEVNLDTPGFYRLKVQAFDESGNWRYKYHDVEVRELLACTMTSDTGTVVVENNEYAVETWQHNNWTAIIPGATWIWETFFVEDSEEDTTLTFQETFTVTDVTDATLDLASDNTFRVFINDALVYEGNNPNNFQTYSQKEFTDVADYLVDGENTLEIEVTSPGVDGSIAKTNPAGVLYKLEINTAGGSCDITTETVDDEAPAVPTGLGWTDSNGASVTDGGTTELVSGKALWNANTETDLSHYIYKYWNNISTSAYNSESAAWTTTTTNTELPGTFNQGEGTHYFCIIAVDNVGNQSACSDEFTVIYDTDSTEPTNSTSTQTITGNTAVGENQPGWMFNRDTSTQSPYQFVLGTSTIGTGSLFINPITNSVNGNNDKFIAELFLLSPMADLDTLSYDFNIAGVDAADENEFYMNVYANFGSSSSTKFYDCRYNVVPTVGVVDGWTTVSFDPSLTYPVTTRTGGEASPHTCPASPAAMNTLDPGSTIRVIALNVGDTSANDLGVSGYFDNVVVVQTTGVHTETTIYDFEPASTSTSPNEDDGDNGGGGGGGGGGGSGPTPQVAGASTDTEMYDLLEEIKNRLAEFLLASYTAPQGSTRGSASGAVLGDSIAQANLELAQNAEDALNNEPDEMDEITPNEEESDQEEAMALDWRNYYWILVLLWLLASAGALWRRNEYPDTIAMKAVQVVFIIVAVLLLAGSLLFGLVGAFWPSLIVTVGAITAYFWSLE